MNIPDATMMKDYIKEELNAIIRAVLAGQRVLGSKVPEFHEQLREYNKKS